MRKVFGQIYKGDPKAEWHPLKTVLFDEESHVLCQVCGEVYDMEYFENGEVITCADCGLNLEMVNIGDGGKDPLFIVIWQDNTVNEDLAAKFYNRRLKK